MTRLALLLLALTVTVNPAVSRAQEADERYIAVTGEGTVAATADVAEVVAGVTTRATTAKEALDRNSSLMTSLMAAVVKAGIAERDVRTTRINVGPFFDEGPRANPNKPAGYQASNMISARVRVLDRLGTILDTLVTAGASDIQGVRFSFGAPETLMDEARRRAMADAKRRASLLAEAAGVGLGNVIRVEELSVQAPRPMMIASQAMARSVPVAPGEDEVSAQINVRFKVEDAPAPAPSATPPR